MKKTFKIVVLAVAIITLCGVVAGNYVASTSAFYSAQSVQTATYKQGSRGDMVKKIQQKLKNWGYYSGKADGIFGAQTKKAVIYFQKKSGLTADGIVGAKTLAALGLKDGGSSSGGTSSTYTNSDINLLARLIYGEARGESYTGQVAVGAVVLNRVKSAAFPNTISGVIYQSYAFTAVADGQINLKPNATAIAAAKDAMNGWDPTGGAIYYYNPSTATSSWIYSRKTLTTIGNHVFAI